MIKAYFTVGQYENIPISPEITYNDLMDGTPDSMSFAFPYEIDLTNEVQLKQKTKTMIEDDIHKLYEVGTISTNEIIINGDTYSVSAGIIYNSNNQQIGETFDNKVVIQDNEYIFENNIIYEDKRKYYYMCIAQITSELLSTDFDNGYFITVVLKEQTLLLKDCVRTDIAISPNLYPQVKVGETSDGKPIYRNTVFNTLYDATLKIIDCHNMCILNDTIEFIDDDLIEELSKMPCPNLTYRDLSTYSQLYDVFMRIGRLPYYENGTLYGIKLDGENTETVKDLSGFSHLSNIKSEGVNDSIYSSKIYNNVYDNEFAIVPSIFSDLVAGYEEQGYINSSGSQTITSEEDLSIFMNAKTTSLKTLEADSVDKLNNLMDVYIEEEYGKWLNMQYSATSDLSKNLLFVNGFNQMSSGIDDVRSFSVELPFNIEYVEDIYLCTPRYLKWRMGEVLGTHIGQVYFGWKLVRVDRTRVIENTMYENLSALQKRITAYYVRGSNKISNIISCMIPEGDDSIFTPGNSALQGAYAWSTMQLYNVLRKAFFVVKYKPITTTTYTNYNYIKELGEEKPMSINNFNLPYSQVSDKQVFSVLEYNLQKGTDNTYNMNFITDDTSILDLKAGDIILFQNKKYIISKYQYIINNNTIECAFELNDNIIQNSILSSYRDNVRVSSNISASNSVDRQIHIFGENVIKLYDDYDTIENNIPEYYNFIQEIGQNLVNASFYVNGLFDKDIYNDPLLNAYGNLSRYPVRSSQIIPEYSSSDDGDGQDGLTVRIDSAVGIGYKTPPENAKHCYYYDFKNDDFPMLVMLHKHYYNTPTFEQIGVGWIEGKDVYLPIKIVYDFDELKMVLFDVGACSIHHDATPYVCHNAIFACGYNSSTGEYDKLVDIRPDYWETPDISRPIETWPTPEKDRLRGWISHRKIGYYEHVAVKKFGTVGNYTYSTIYNDFVHSNYITDKLITNSGLITKIDYAPIDTLFAGSKYKVEGQLEKRSITNLADGNGIMVDQPPMIEMQTPLRFNTTENGCRLECIGKSINDFYSFYNLPMYSGVGLYLDMRENIRPYIQYKTRGIKTRTFDIKELNQNYSWLSTVSSFTKVNPFVSGKIYKIDKRTSLLSFNPKEEDKVTTLRISSKMNANDDEYKKYGNGIVSFDMSNTPYLLSNNNYDYCLTLVRQNGEEEHLIKFNINSGEVAYTGIKLMSTIYTNYNKEEEE